jgi:hypothetical protein
MPIFSKIVSLVWLAIILEELLIEHHVPRYRVAQTACFAACAIPDTWSIWPGMSLELGLLSMLGWVLLLASLASKKLTNWLRKPLSNPWSVPVDNK